MPAEPQPFHLGAPMPSGGARNVLPWLFMLGGCTMVMAAVLLVNGLIETGPRKTAPRTTQFVPAAPVKAPSVPNRRAPQKSVRRSSMPHVARAPLPGLAGSLSGVDFGLPQFQMVDPESLTEAVLGEIGSTAMTEESVDTPPRVVQRAAIPYPPRARSQGLSGHVTLNLLIDPDGRVEQARVIESEPTGVFDDAALLGVKQWIFQPGAYKGRNVRVWIRQTLRFDLT